MPSLGAGEIIVIFVLVLVLFGPNRLPELARGLGKGMREMRKISAEFQNQLSLIGDELTEDKPRPVSKSELRAEASMATVTEETVRLDQVSAPPPASNTANNGVASAAADSDVTAVASATSPSLVKNGEPTETN